MLIKQKKEGTIIPQNQMIFDDELKGGTIIPKNEMIFDTVGKGLIPTKPEVKEGLLPPITGGLIPPTITEPSTTRFVPPSPTIKEKAPIGTLDLYKKLGSEFLSGIYGATAGSLYALDSWSKWLSEKTGLKRGKLFKELADSQKLHADYFSKHGLGKDASGTVAIAKHIYKGIGSAVMQVPMIMSVGLPAYSAIHGGAEAIEADESVLKGTAEGFAHGLLLHGILQGAGIMRLPERAMIGATTFGGASLGEELQRPAEQRDYERVIADFFVGGGLLIGGRGRKTTKEVLEDIKYTYGKSKIDKSLEELKRYVEKEYEVEEKPAEVKPEEKVLERIKEREKEVIPERVPEKESWEMTRVEYGIEINKKLPTAYEKTPEQIEWEHKQIIKKALKEGKLIQPEVLKEYPDLVKKKPPEVPVEKKVVKKIPPKPFAKLEKYRKDIEIIRAGFEAGEPGYRRPLFTGKAIDLEELTPAERQAWIGEHSTYPFRGYERKEVLNITGKALAGKSLTGKQTLYLEELIKKQRDSDLKKLLEQGWRKGVSEELKTEEELYKDIRIINEKELSPGDKFTIEGEDYEVAKRTKEGLFLVNDKKIELGKGGEIEIDKGSLEKAKVPVEIEPEKVRLAKKIREKVKPEVKEPWEMTREEFNKLYKKSLDEIKLDVDKYDIKGKLTREGKFIESLPKLSKEDISRIGEDPSKQYDIIRRAVIKEALAEGKPVPPEVLKDYPDLVKKVEVEKPAERIKEKKPWEGKKPWELDAITYQEKVLGVHQPWIAEIAPSQYARLSKRQKAEYDKKRSAEWQASADAKKVWRDKIMEAYDKGEIGTKTPNLHREAESVIYQELRKREEVKKKEALEKAIKENKIKLIDDINIGDKVFHVVVGRYGEVIKKFKKSVRLIFKEPIYRDVKELKAELYELDWKKYNDLKKEVESKIKPIEIRKKPLEKELKRPPTKAEIEVPEEKRPYPTTALFVTKDVKTGEKILKNEPVWFYPELGGMVKQKTHKKLFQEFQKTGKLFYEGELEKYKVKKPKEEIKGQERLFGKPPVMRDIVTPERAVKKIRVKTDFYEDILEGKLTKKDVERSFKQRKDFKVTKTGLIGQAITPISTLIQKISPKLKYRRGRSIRQLEFDIRMKSKEYLEKVTPFLNAKKRFNDKERYVFDLAQKNGDMDIMTKFVEKYKIRNEYDKYRDAMNDIIKMAKEVGYDVKYLKHYFHREIKDSQGLINYLEGTDDWGIISNSIKLKTEQLKRTLTVEEEAKIADSILRGWWYGRTILGKPGALKERRITVITPEIDKFYYDSDTATVMYINRVTDAIVKRKFFGKHLKTRKKGDINQLEFLEEVSENIVNDIDLEKSIGSYTAELIRNGEITKLQENQLKNALQARFGYIHTNKTIAMLKNLIYGSVLGTPYASVTQIGDMGFALYDSGVYGATKEYGKSIFGKARIKRNDVGITEIATEFTSPPKLGNAVAKMFKWIGFTKIDKAGKESIINSAILVLGKQAKANKISKKNKQLLEWMFEDGGKQIIEDLKADKTTEDMRYYGFSKVADYQPVALSEMPIGYLKSPKLRILYSLKTYDIKLIDVWRREVIWNIKDGIKNRNRTQTVDGIRNMVRLGICLALANIPANVIKSIMLGRDFTLTDKAVDSILRFGGLSRYLIDQARRLGPAEAIVGMITPPTEPWASAGKDVLKLMAEGKDFDFKNANVWKVIPGIGKFYYWWFGKGREYELKQRKSKSKLERERAKKTKRGLR